MLTVLGASGFIGSHLVNSLRAEGIQHDAPARGDDLAGRHLGHVVFCIGVTADFRSRPFDAVEAHVCRLLDVVKNCSFESLTYLSSTRVYRSGDGPAREGDYIFMDPQRIDDLYGLSKATGEALVAARGGAVRSARLSNVYGADPETGTFLASVIGQAITEKHVHLQTSLESAKDYVSIEDVVNLLPRIASAGTQPLYNLASGHNVTNLELMTRLAELTGCSFDVAPGAPTAVFPSISIERLVTEFAFTPRRLVEDLPALIEAYANHVRQHPQEGRRAHRGTERSG